MSLKSIYGVRDEVTSFDGKSDRTIWYRSRATRDKALAGRREAMIRRGLSVSVATLGIYPVMRRNPSRDAYEAAEE